MSASPDPEVLRRLREANWALLGPRLVAFASRLKVTSALRKGGIALPKGNEVQDIVQQAVTLTFEGTTSKGPRGWKPETCDLETHLQGVIRSLLSNLGTSQEHKLGGFEPVPDLPHPGGTPEDLSLQRERQDALFSDLIDVAAGEKQMAAIVDGLMENLAPGEIAKAKNLSPDEVYMGTRTLLRRVRALRREGGSR